MKCAVKGCSEKKMRSKATENIRYHKFPANSAMRNKWLHAIGRADLVVTRYDCVCSKHFRPSDVFSSGWLLRDAIPSVAICVDNLENTSELRGQFSPPGSEDYLESEVSDNQNKKQIDAGQLLPISKSEKILEDQIDFEELLSVLSPQPCVERDMVVEGPFTSPKAGPSNIRKPKTIASTRTPCKPAKRRKYLQSALLSTQEDLSTSPTSAKAQLRMKVKILRDNIKQKNIKIKQLNQNLRRKSRKIHKKLLELSGFCSEIFERQFLRKSEFYN